MSLSKSCILYIEDHEDTRDLIKLVLEDQDYDVATATSVATALNLAKSQRFDLYLLDSRLPDGSGWIFAERCVRLTLLRQYSFTQRRRMKSTDKTHLSPEHRDTLQNRRRAKISAR
jgi:CheY-like chemotaxis protein